MTLTDEIIKSALESDEAFRKTLRKIIKELGSNVSEFAKEAHISPSTLYKLIEGVREPNLRTLRKVTGAVQKISGEGEHQARGAFIAVIAARTVLDRIEERVMDVEGKPIKIREYPATSMEDAIIAAVRAERDGAAALVCAPIVSTTVEKIVNIPVATIIPRSSLIRALELASRKLRA
jgi:predicted transcriptional regulator